jgi:hypothetical protein
LDTEQTFMFPPSACSPHSSRHILLFPFMDAHRHPLSVGSPLSQCESFAANADWSNVCLNDY